MPLDLMLATESDFVSTRSPAKIADDLGIVPPLIHAVPFVYSIAAAESAGTLVLPANGALSTEGLGAVIDATTAPVLLVR